MLAIIAAVLAIIGAVLEFASNLSSPNAWGLLFAILALLAAHLAFPVAVFGHRHQP